MSSIEHITFSCDEYEYQGEQEPGRVRVWFTPDGDGLGLFFFPVPPDLPSHASSVIEISAFYESMLANSGGKLVETRITEIDGCAAVQIILSVPQEPNGRTYVGSVTIPFRDFSFVLKVQCAEHGTTGVKEAILFDRSRSSGKEMKIEDGRFEIPGWNPDSEEYDAEFPTHPVARARRVLRDIAASTTVADQVKNSSAFTLPQ